MFKRVATFDRDATEVMKFNIEWSRQKQDAFCHDVDTCLAEKRGHVPLGAVRSYMRGKKWICEDNFNYVLEDAGYKVSSGSYIVSRR